MQLLPFSRAPCQSVLLRAGQQWFHRRLFERKRFCTARTPSRDVGHPPLATISKDWVQRGGDCQMQESVPESFACSQSDRGFVYACLPQNAPDEEHVVTQKNREDVYWIFHAIFQLGIVPYVDARQATEWIRSITLFLFVSFVLGIRAASASQTHPTHLPIVPVVSSDFEAEVSASSLEVDAVLGESARSSVHVIISNSINGDQEHGVTHKAEGNDNDCCTSPKRNSKDDKYHTQQDHNCGCHGSVHKRSADISLNDDSMQQPRFMSSESQTQTRVNNSSGADDTMKEWGEKLGEEKDMGRNYKDGGLPAYKLIVPLRIVSLRGSVPPLWLKDFMMSQGKRVKFTSESQGDLKEIMSALASDLKKKQVKPRSILAADIVTVGDSWLQAAVSGRLIEPIENAEHHEWFNRLGPKWQAFLRRDHDGRIDPRGLIWGAPYRWGSMVIAFRTDKFLKSNIPGIEDWVDLWKPELTGKISMVDSSREVVGAVLKSLGASYNAQDFDKDVKGGRDAVRQQFLALQKQVKVFDSVHYLKALASDDVWVAVGWSSDVIPVAKRMSNIRVVAPKSGGSLWADLWAIPAAKTIPSNKIGSRVYGASPLVRQWLDFCLQPARGIPFEQGVFVGASPLYAFGGDHDLVVSKENRSLDDNVGRAIDNDPSSAAKSRTKGPAMDTNMIEGMPVGDFLEKSEVMEPLSEKAIAEYQWLFSQAEEQGGFRQEILQKMKQLLKSVKQK